MKNVMLVCFALLPFFTFAQQEGSISFTETTEVKIELPEDLGLSEEQIAKMMPSEIKENFVLYFNNSESLYKNAHEEEKEDEVQEFGSEESGFIIKMVSSTSESALYQNLKKGTSIEQQDFMQKTFLIKGESEKLAWKLSKETKEIAGYTCTKATFEEEDRTVEAWFTTQIPVATGPSGYTQLPGMILELNTKGENNSRGIAATAITLETLEKGTLVAPKKGKQVTQEEFDKIVEERTKELHDSMGGRGSINIRMN